MTFFRIGISLPCVFNSLPQNLDGLVREEPAQIRPSENRKPGGYSRVGKNGPTQQGDDFLVFGRQRRAAGEHGRRDAFESCSGEALRGWPACIEEERWPNAKRRADLQQGRDQEVLLAAFDLGNVRLCDARPAGKLGLRYALADALQPDLRSDGQHCNNIVYSLYYRNLAGCWCGVV